MEHLKRVAIECRRPAPLHSVVPQINLKSWNPVPAWRTRPRRQPLKKMPIVTGTTGIVRFNSEIWLLDQVHQS
jgi:hypothetical protein